MFSKYSLDTYKVYANGKEVEVLRKGLIHEAERDRYTPTGYDWTDVTEGIKLYYIESFHAWMQISPINPIRKLYGIINQELEGTIKFTVNDSKVLC